VPTPLDGAGRDGTFVGRLRADQAAAPGKGLAFFTVGDNCLTGAYKLLKTCHAVFPGMPCLFFFGLNSEQKRW